MYTPAITLRAIEESDRAWLPDFLRERWGSQEMVIRGEVFYPAELPGFAAFDEDGDCCGLITMHILGNDCEIISLDSLEEHVGVGSALLKAAERSATAHGCTRLHLVTTNDNLNALRFYQKRGYYLCALRPGAIEESRKLKPQIPHIGEFGIPIRDEIELEKKID
jgi:GNAT superfamily N-acetyltransferase